MTSKYSLMSDSRSLVVGSRNVLEFGSDFDGERVQASNSVVVTTSNSTVNVNTV